MKKMSFQLSKQLKFAFFLIKNLFIFKKYVKVQHTNNTNKSYFLTLNTRVVFTKLS